MSRKSYVVLALILVSLFGVKALASLSLNATTIAGSGDVIVSSGGTTAATFSVPTGNSLTSNFFNIAGTLPANPSSTTAGMDVTITGAGSSAQAIRGANIELAAGYTGTNLTTGLRVGNASAGTNSNSSWFGAGGNKGIYALATGSGATTNNAIYGVANGITSYTNVGVQGVSTPTSSGAQYQIGVAGFARKATTGTAGVGGFFGLMAATPTLTTSAALIADNGAEVGDIIHARENGTPVWSVRDGGAMNLAPQASAPTSPASGDMYVDSTANPDELCFYDGAVWQAVISGTDANCQ